MKSSNKILFYTLLFILSTAFFLVSAPFLWHDWIVDSTKLPFFILIFTGIYFAIFSWAYAFEKPKYISMSKIITFFAFAIVLSFLSFFSFLLIYSHLINDFSLSLTIILIIMIFSISLLVFLYFLKTVLISSLSSKEKNLELFYRKYYFSILKGWRWKVDINNIFLLTRKNLYLVKYYNQDDEKIKSIIFKHKREKKEKDVVIDLFNDDECYDVPHGKFILLLFSQ